MQKHNEKIGFKINKLDSKLKSEIICGAQVLQSPNSEKSLKKVSHFILESGDRTPIID